MSEACDLCRSLDLDRLYQPEGTQRGLSIHACRACGLVQSLPRQDRAPRAAANISAGADWGNLRYGKGFRVPPHLALVKPLLSPHDAPKILDVGSNRGAFIDAALEAWPRSQIVAVEPDERVTGGYERRAGISLQRARIEDCGFGAESFDLIYSSHTLEHVASPRRVLKQHAAVLRPSGFLFLEVPNIAIIGDADIVEEWFIDKHLHHFSAATLKAMLAVAGFEIVSGPVPDDHEYLTVVARRAEHASEAASVIDAAEHDRAAALVRAFRTRRQTNTEHLKSAARAIMSHRGRVAIWGAGRLFDALVREGGLETQSLAGLIDEGLRKHMSERHGVRLSAADDLPSFKADLLVIASRSFAGEIRDRANFISPSTRIVTFAELLEDARRAA